MIFQKQKLIKWLWLVTLTFLAACSSQVNYNKKKVEKSNQPVEEGAVTNVSLKNGASISLPPGGAPAGSDVNLKSADTLQTFSTVDISPASLALDVAVTNSSGQELTELNEPMMVNIPLASTSLRLVDVAVENLCALLEARDGSKLVWRAARLEVSGEEVKFLTKKLGTFQLAYCGEEELPGFNNVEEEELSSVDNWENEYGIDADSGEEKESDASITVVIPAAYTSGHGKLCSSLLKAETRIDSKGNEDGPEPTEVIIAQEDGVTSGSDVTLSFDYQSTKIGEQGVFFVALFLAEGVECTWPTVTSIDEAFQNQDFTSLTWLSISAADATNYSATLGTGDYALSKFTLKLGGISYGNGGISQGNSGIDVITALKSNTSLSNKFTSVSGCARMETDHEDESKTQFGFETTINISNLSFDGSDTIELYVPSGGGEVELDMGGTCAEQMAEEGESTADSGTHHYTLTFSDTEPSETHYLLPAYIGMSETDANQSRCLSFFNSGDYQNLSTNTRIDPIAEFEISTNPINGSLNNQYAVYLPFTSQHMTDLNNGDDRPWDLVLYESCGGGSVVGVHENQQFDSINYQRDFN